MSDVLGYVVVEWGRISKSALMVHSELFASDEVSEAHESARLLQADEPARRFSVHAVMAEEIEEGS